MVDGLPPETNIIVFGEPQLPLQGVVDDKFIQWAMKEIPNGTEYLVVYLDDAEYEGSHWFADEDNDELRTNLQEHFGKHAAVGPYPNFFDEESNLVSAIVPGLDGVVRLGIY
jgi:hypothetical protein